MPVGAGRHGIVTGPDDDAWVAEGQLHGIARVTQAGQVTQYTLARDRYPNTLWAAPDGTLWVSFSSTSGNGGFARVTAPG